MRRLAVWAAELLSQAVLLSAVLIVISGRRFGYEGLVVGKTLFSLAVAILTIFLITGYMPTTAILRFVWKAPTPRLYSAVATLLFVIHFEALNLGIGGAFDPRDRLPIVIAGACLAFISTLIGSTVLRKWSAGLA